MQEKLPIDFVAEAEKIINNYMAKERKMPVVQSKPTPPTVVNAPAPRPSAVKAPAKKQKSAFDFTLNMVMILACIAIIIVFMYGMLA